MPEIQLFSFLLQYFLLVCLHVLFFISGIILVPLIRSQRIFSLTRSFLLVLLVIGLLKIYSLDYRNILTLIYTAGVLLNIIAVLSNEGRMPVDINAVKIAWGLSDEEAKIQLDEICLTRRQHRIMTDATRFKMLGDRFGYSICSIGDILIEYGHFLLVIQFLLVSLFFIFKYSS